MAQEVISEDDREDAEHRGVGNKADPQEKPQEAADILQDARSPGIVVGLWRVICSGWHWRCLNPW